MGLRRALCLVEKQDVKRGTSKKALCCFPGTVVHDLCQWSVPAMSQSSSSSWSYVGASQHWDLRLLWSRTPQHSFLCTVGQSLGTTSLKRPCCHPGSPQRETLGNALLSILQEGVKQDWPNKTDHPLPPPKTPCLHIREQPSHSQVPSAVNTSPGTGSLGQHHDALWPPGISPGCVSREQTPSWALWCLLALSRF